MSETKELVIIAGANGSGKTTFAYEFLKIYPYTYLNADEFAKQINPDNISEARIAAAKKLFTELDICKNQNKNILIESTLSGLAMKKIIDDFAVSGYKIKIFYIFVDAPDICIERIKERVIKGGHFVPDEDVRRRFWRSINNFWDSYKNKSDEWMVVFNTENVNIDFIIGYKEKYIVNNFEYFNKFIQFTKLKH